MKSRNHGSRGPAAGVRYPARVQIEGLDHVQLAMPPGGEADARAFYADVLGLREVPKPPPLAERGGCWFEGPVTLHLGVEPDFRPARKAHPALTVADLTEAEAHLASHGVMLRRDESVPELVRGYLEDPFGNRIELIEAAR